VRFADREGREELLAHAALRRSAFVPGLAPILEVQAPDGSDRPYVVLGSVGLPLSSRLARTELGRGLALAWCREACLLLGALAASGIVLPDAAFPRFNVGRDERLWLTDLWGAQALVPAEALGRHAGLARAFCLDVLGHLLEDPVSSADAAALRGDASLADILVILDRIELGAGGVPASARPGERA
jgi:hypothetical protein